ncbi:uncharacterized protein TRIADDRAFT_31022 [Trichoplax adhaerens]|uniref:FAD/NAD(P)-binding domain-containing protein n=1 Tax=Trichoplax adhaerens TaxID=10228 RepID=B3S8F3_TRIAD|nr:hypothetical protein TRIADDRAFT_31022 [Trichoplax adhaerens]EDV20875.1 hypothetical protein TRIADDRAFT_31022 [Trichoplax adhaerens]|eukprot:XP_002116519.1 hypothetical protein TRIADDRAFT_31022 [Trichoplax adhaerens]
MANIFSFTFLLLALPFIIQSKFIKHQYCIVGAGPGGLQMAYFLQRAGRDYIVFERHNIAGSFFTHYPRHRRLLSLNKQYTGSLNSEFNLRHDWNTLLSDNDSLKMTRYSDDLYPHADQLVRYLNDYANRLQLNIQYQTDIVKLSRGYLNGINMFKLIDQHQNIHLCNVTIISTGLSKPKIPDTTGMQYAEGYESISTNTSEYVNKNVLILGQGNSAFETAQAISNVAGLVHLYGRGGVRLATSTHYIGDLRAVNSKIVDSYQLKSLDGIVEGPLENFGILKRKKGLISIALRGTKDELFLVNDMTGTRKGYHHVIRCLGFEYDRSIFGQGCRPRSAKKESIEHYPDIKANYEAVSVAHMYFAGALTHSLDYRHSGGCCIQGFRYSVRALHRLLEWRYHQVPWPAKLLSSEQLLYYLSMRINQASGTYQMFGMLADVVLIGDNHQHLYLEEVPTRVIPNLENLAGRKVTYGFLALTFEYGKNFSQPNKDTLDRENYSFTARNAYRSRNIHPILRYYKHHIRGKSKVFFILGAQVLILQI